MSRINALRIAKWLLVGMATLPAALYAYLGHFSRMVLDDFAFLHLGSKLGPLQHALYWRSKWMSSYSNPFLHGLLGPFDRVVPSAFPTIIIVIWILGLTWLISQLLFLLKVKQHRLALAVSVAALTVAASINAFHTPQSFYWYAASLPYTLPLALFCVYLALMLETVRRARPIAWLAPPALGSAMICFVIAGFSELYLVFQLAFMSLFLAIMFAFTTGKLRWKVVALIGSGWFGTIASLAVQWTSPGRSLRAEVIWQYPQFQPIRHLPDLVGLGLRDLYNLAMDQETIIGFMLLFAIGMLASQWAKPRLLPTVFSGGASIGNGRLPYLAGLALQLGFFPVIWAHRSDNPLFFGRFSLTFMTVVMMNIALIAGFLLTVWRFRQVSAFLRRHQRRLPAYVLIVTLIGLTLLAAPQLREIHMNAVIFLFVSALSLLALAWWEWTSAMTDRVEKTFRLFPLASTGVALLSVAALIIVPRYFVGIGALRHWSAAAFVLVTQGLVWGVVVGQSLRRLGENAQERLRRASAVIFVIAYAIIVIGQIRLIPDFAQFAREWDQRHALLLELKESGQTQVSIPRRAFDLDIFLLHGEIVSETRKDFSGALLHYYGFESITVAESG